MNRRMWISTLSIFLSVLMLFTSVPFDGMFVYATEIQTGEEISSETASEVVNKEVDESEEVNTPEAEINDQDIEKQKSDGQQEEDKEEPVRTVSDNDMSVNEMITITFDANGGLFDDDSKTCVIEIEKGKSISEKPADPVYPDEAMVFSGWYVDKEYTREINIESTVFEENTILYAGWDFQSVSENSLSNVEYTLTYTLNEYDNAIITGYEGIDRGELVIPEKIEGHEVTGIKSSAFSYTEFSGDLILPDSIVSIGSCAFIGCDGLTGKLILPKSIIIIGDGAFQDCGFSGALTLPDTLISIGAYAFGGCEGLSGSLTLPKSLTYLGDAAFLKCGFTGTLELPSSLTSIPADAFSACKFSGNLVIPGNIKTIGDYAFSWNNFTGAITFSEGVEYIGKGAFFSCNREHKDLQLTFPSTLKYIGDEAFESCLFTGDLIIPDSVEYIGEKAFACGQHSIKKAVIPGSIKTIYPYTFKQMGNSTAKGNFIIIKEGVERIEEGAFDYCLVHDITLPESLNYIEGNPFGQLSKYVIFNCVRGSYAYNWAQEQGLNINSIEGAPKAFSIVFNKNGGTGTSMASISVNKGDTVQLPKCIFTRVGYNFAGWCLNKNGTGKIYEDTGFLDASVLTEKTTTLFAVWTPKKYTVEYVLNGGELLEDNPTVIEYGKTYKLKSPIKKGMKFIGWYSEPTFKKKVSMLDGRKATNIVLYAKWGGAAVYKIKYVNPKGTVMGKNPTKYTIADATKVLQPAVRKGYAFTGWYTDVNLTNKITQINSGSYGDITLYSGWTASSYTIVYNGNGATGGSTPDSYHQYMTRGAISENGYTKTGYTFSNWYRNAKCTGTKYIPGNSDNDLAYIDGTIVNLYAGWTPNKYSVIYNGNGATSGSTKTSIFKYDDVKCTIAKNGFKREGYEFAEWNTKADGTGTSYKASAKGAHNLTTGTGQVILYAQWKPILRVTYDGNGSTGGSVKPTILKYGTKNTLASNNFNRTGYIFVEWNTRADGSGKAYKAKANSNNELISDDPDGNTTLYAQWKPITYTIVLDAKDKKQPAVKIKAKYDENIILPNNTFVKKGYYFIEWFSLKLDPKLKIGFFPAQSVVKNLSSKEGDTITLYPKWAYKVYYDANGGTGSMDASEFFIDTNGNLTKNQFSKNGYTFNGWKAEINKKTKLFKDGQSVKDLINSDGTAVTLKAQWSPKSCYIYYNPNTGNAASDKKNEKKVEYKYGTEYAIKKNDFKRKGYVFDSWNTSPNGDGTRYEVGQKVVNPPSKLYAFWKQDIKVTSVAFNQKEITVRLNQPTCMYQYVTVLPENAAVNKLSWKSSNSTIAKIDQDGNLTGLKEGTVTITATSKDGTNKSSSIEVKLVNRTRIQDFIEDSRWENGIYWGGDTHPKTFNEHYWDGTGCCAYAIDFAWFVYGRRFDTGEEFHNMNEICAGDAIYIGGHHWFVVLERNGNKLYTAEGNFLVKNTGFRRVYISDNRYTIDIEKGGIVHGDEVESFTVGKHFAPR